MSLFLLGFFCFYGGGHLYLLCRLQASFALRRRGILLLSAWALLMVVAPILLHWLSGAGFTAAARLAAVVAYSWMGLLFYFIVIALLLDGLLVFAWLVARVCGRRPGLPWANRRLVSGLVLFAILVVGYGFFEARAIRVERVVLPTTKLPQGVERLAIVQLADLHLGLLVGRKRLRAVLDQVRLAEPDLMVATGDLVDGHGDHFAEFSGLLRELEVSLGKFAILGNHEFYAGAAHSQQFLEQAGFVVLRNRAQAVAGGVIVAGVDDRRGATWPVAKTGAEAQLLAGLAGAEQFVLLLKHRPQVDPASLGRFDLQLSGHVHQGQLFPFGQLVKRFYPVKVEELMRLSQGYLYVNRGAGTWGPPIRVLAPPTVTLIELVAADAR